MVVHLSTYTSNSLIFLLFGFKGIQVINVSCDPLTCNEGVCKYLILYWTFMHVSLFVCRVMWSYLSTLPSDTLVAKLELY